MSGGGGRDGKRRVASSAQTREGIEERSGAGAGGGKTKQDMPRQDREQTRQNTAKTRQGTDIGKDTGMDNDWLVLHRGTDKDTGMDNDCLVLHRGTDHEISSFSASRFQDPVEILRRKQRKDKAITGESWSRLRGYIQHYKDR